VLTTYETLRDLEFSFAAEKWSIMICDEAQRIKNPNAMVTRAAKKQNVIFRVACTGTPVENTLADLWCLFDYVQPGLLGALNDFGRRYRRPIEAETEEEQARVKELREADFAANSAADQGRSGQRPPAENRCTEQGSPIIPTTLALYPCRQRLQESP
jgi:SNF2 family DNA or RNA helicase